MKQRTQDLVSRHLFGAENGATWSLEVRGVRVRCPCVVRHIICTVQMRANANAAADD